MASYPPEAYAQLLATACLYLLSILGVASLAARATRPVYKVLIWIIGVVAVLLSTFVMLETASLVPR